MITVLQRWWSFSGSNGGVGAPLLWWTVFTAVLFIFASVYFLPCRQSAKPLALARWGFLIVMVVLMAIHFYVVVLTWTQVWFWLYDINHSWTPVEQDKHVFEMWWTALSLAVLSSCLWVGSLILMKPQTAANTTSEDIVANRSESSR